MCEFDQTAHEVTRRALIIGGWTSILCAMLGGGNVQSAEASSESPKRDEKLFGMTRVPSLSSSKLLSANRRFNSEVYGLTVKPRSSWAAGLSAKGPLNAESDVRFLLVHHSASPNNYEQGEVPGILRGFFDFHTGTAKGWPDVAYNFFVDRFGGVWEGRTGSLDGPVVGSATGGNQGYSQLCCLIGTFDRVPPSAAQEGALTKLLASLSDLHQIDTNPDSVVEFMSRGSNRHKAGTTVRTPTINGHRSMSLTTCPGDAAWDRLPVIRKTVHLLRSQKRR